MPTNPTPVPAARCWRLARNCAVTPRQALSGFGLVATLGAALAIASVVLGYPVIAAFAAAEVVAFGVALLAWARHAGDRETVTLDGGRLVIERVEAGVSRHWAWHAAWVHVGVPQRADGLIRVHAGGREVLLGRHVPAAERGRLAADLDRELALARGRTA